MTLDIRGPNDIRRMVDAEHGLVSRVIFSDEEIFEREMERIFFRVWNFMCHESQIPTPGDFFATLIGTSKVIVVRDRDMNVQVLLNTCRHRGNAICRAEEGHATSFMCTYHGWTYDLTGSLIGVPGAHDYYGDTLKREDWGLIKAAQVGSYNGFVFATMDSSAPSLYDFLGEAGRQGIDGFCAQGNMKAYGGIPKYVIPANWKLAHDNNWDFYHTTITHASPRLGRANYGGFTATPGVLRNPNVLRPIFLGEYGHAATDTAARSLFPNVFMNGTEIEMRMPRGPRQTELWRWSFYGADWDEEKKKNTKRFQNHHLGAAGFFGMDDGENWGDCTTGSMGVIERRYPYHYAMSLRRGDIVHDEGQPPRIDVGISEHSQMWIYRCWAEFMAADSWEEYLANAPKTEGKF